METVSAGFLAAAGPCDGCWVPHADSPAQRRRAPAIRAFIARRSLVGGEGVVTINVRDRGRVGLNVPGTGESGRTDEGPRRTGRRLEVDGVAVVTLTRPVQ